MNADELRYKMKHLGVLCPNRSVANDDELFTLYSKFYDVILETNYKVDIGDCISALHLVFENMDMYE